MLPVPRILQALGSIAAQPRVSGGCTLWRRPRGVDRRVVAAGHGLLHGGPSAATLTRGSILDRDRLPPSAHTRSRQPPATGRATHTPPCGRPDPRPLGGAVHQAMLLRKALPGGTAVAGAGITGAAPATAAAVPPYTVWRRRAQCTLPSKKPVFFDMVHSNNAARVRLWMHLKRPEGMGDVIETRTVAYPGRIPTCQPATLTANTC
jgi:hypothetical protein